MPGSYPALRRASAQPAWARPQTFGGRALVFPANDPAPPTLAEARFMAMIERATLREAVITAGGGVLEGIAIDSGIGLVALIALPLLWQVVTPGSVTTLPRDPNNADDMALAWPSGIVSSYSDWSGQPATWLGQSTDRWYSYSHSASAPAGEFDRDALRGSLYQDIDAGDYPQLTATTVPDLVALGVPPGKEVIRYERADVIGDGLSTRDVETHYNPASVAVAPTYANPPRTEETPGQTRTYELPGAEPGRMPWEEIPTQPRTPWSESGPVPAGPATEAYIPPTTTIILPGQGGSPSVEVTPGVVTPRRPPGPDEKQKKPKIMRGNSVQGLYHSLATGAGIATEALDLLNALWKQLPPTCRTGFKEVYSRKAGGKIWIRKYYANQSQKARDLYRCWGEISAETLINTMRNLEVTDMLQASGGKLAKRAVQRLGEDGYWHSPKGFMTGPWDSAATDALKQMLQQERLARHRKAQEERRLLLGARAVARKAKRVQRAARKLERLAKHKIRDQKRVVRKAKHHAYVVKRLKRFEWAQHHVRKQRKITSV